ncbi:MAG TPA: tetraacyldisaccharide 4'-kinase [Phnomibacter sp.]|nr:tetraacyldisaccharide 4'-kinase [Phnomibacter sp.]
MHFNFYLIRGLRFLLFPLSLLMALVVMVRNKMYDWKWKRSVSFNLPLICVGNLSVGGTGKSPMTELLIGWLKPHYKLATLSRGYKRKTKGYLLANEHTSALEIGDEPMQFHIKFPEVAVAVGEERIVAVPQLLQDRPETEAIILDDAFQHRSITAGLNILLTDYSNPYWYDWFLPSGDLRDQRKSAARAQIIVVTKCPPGISEEEKNTILQKINPASHQQVYFVAFEYGTPYHILSAQEYILTHETEVLLVCGIANPTPLKKHLETHAAAYDQLSYSDHYVFTIDDLNTMRQKFNSMQAQYKMLLTTEKDAVRLVKFGTELNQLPLYVQPVRHKVLFGEEEKFKATVLAFVQNFGKEKDHE